MKYAHFLSFYNKPVTLAFKINGDNVDIYSAEISGKAYKNITPEREYKLFKYAVKCGVNFMEVAHA